MLDIGKEFGISGFNINGGAIFSQVMLVLEVGVAIGAGIFALIYILKWLQYKDTVEILEVCNSSGEGKYLSPDYDKGRIIKNKKENREYYRLLKRKKDIPIPPLDFRTPKKGKKGYVIRLLQIGDDNFMPYKPIYNEFAEVVKDYKIIDPDDKNFLTEEIRRQAIKYTTQTGLQKILPFLSVAVAAVVLLLGYYFLLEKSGDISNAMSSLGSSIKEAAQIMARAAGGTPPPSP